MAENYSKLLPKQPRFKKKGPSSFFVWINIFSRKGRSYLFKTIKSYNSVFFPSKVLLFRKWRRI